MKKGRFGEFGGQYITETLMSELEKPGKNYNETMRDESVLAELERLAKQYTGRTSLLQ